MSEADRTAGEAGRDAPRLLAVGRLNLDLYVEPLGRAIAEASHFVPSVGGSPTNTAIAARKLGLPAAVLSATGDDEAGDLVLRQLEHHGVGTRWIGRDSQASTSLALLSTLGPDQGERQFYRHDPADTHLTLEVLGDLPWESMEVVLCSADALASGSTADVVRALSQESRRRGIAVWWDLDLRQTSWKRPGTYSNAVRPALVHADVVIGTEAEYEALFADDARELPAIEQELMALPAPDKLLKRGAAGIVHVTSDGSILSVPAASTNPVCTVGGGDTTAGALIAARTAGRPWAECLSFAMRAAAWTVEHRYCSTGFPTLRDLGLTSLDDLSDRGLK